MASKQSVVDYLLEQMADAGPMTARKMFGEYGVYCGPKVIALVCDDELFIKPTGPGRALLGEVDERPAYPGGKPWFWISGDRWDDGEWLAEVVRVTADALPVPPPKKPKGEREGKGKSEAKPKSAPKPKAKPKSAPKPKAKPKSAPKPKAKPKSAPKAKPKSAPKARSEKQPK